MGSSVFTPFSEKELIPQEERLEVLRKGKKLQIGIPKENALEEKRLCLTPDAVHALVGAGHNVILESGAGEGSFYTDLQYSEAGAEITRDRARIFGQNIVIKMNPPTLEEVDLLKPNAYLISALQINLCNKEFFKRLSEKKINAIAFEYITDEYHQFSLIRLIGEIAGTISILYASELLAASSGQMLGGITGVRPTEVVIIGAGIVGEFATKAAIGLGANVKVFDNSLSKLRRLHMMVDNRVPTSTIDPKELEKSIRRADVIIGAMPRINLYPIITEEMVSLMKSGSVIIDLTVDSGRCVETSKLTTLSKPTFTRHGVIHCGVPNLTSKMPRSTTKAISNFFLGYLLESDLGGGFENVIMKSHKFKESLYMYKGRLTKEPIAKKFGMQYHDINLLIF